MRSPKLVILIALAMLLLTPGCALINSLVEYPTPTPEPQRALRPTFTPTAPAPVEAVAEAVQPTPPTETPTASAPPPVVQATAEPAQPEPPTAEPPTPEPPVPTVAPAVVVPGEPVGAHSGPGVTYDQVTELAAGTQLAIVGKNDAGDWWQVCCVNEQPVWVLGEQVDEQGSLDAIAVAANIPPSPTPTATPVPKPVVVISIPRVNARSGPSTDFPVLEQVLQDTRLEIVGRTAAGDWWQVCCVNGQPAWVAAEVVRTEGPVETVALAADLPTPTPAATPTQAVAATGGTPQPSPVAGRFPFVLTEQSTFPFNRDYLRVGVKARDANDQPLAGYTLRVLNETTGQQWLSRQTAAGNWQFTAPSPTFDDFRQANLLFDTRGKASLTGNRFAAWLVDGQNRQVSPVVHYTPSDDEFKWLYVVFTRQ